MQFSVKDILPNPFRHISRYPIRREKVAALKESIRTTGFWSNIVARPKDGKAEIAYGHHRLVAIKEELGPSAKVELIVRKLTDESMLQIMARENMEEWGTSAAVEHETIRAVVEAFGKGLVELPKPDSGTSRNYIRYAPSFVAGDPSGARREDRPYTAQTLAEFVGWLTPKGEASDKVQSALTALEFIEEGLLKESDFQGLTTKQAEAVVEETRKAKNRRDSAARVQRLQAEQAAREAELAERRRAEAERERRRQEAAAAAAKDAAVRRARMEDVKRAERQSKEAEGQRKEAVGREKVARKQERSYVQEGRRSATVVGRAVSSGLKTGKIGYRAAADLALKADTKKDRVPVDLEDYTRRLGTDLNTILDPTRDPRVKRLQDVLKYQEYLNDITRGDLAKTLEKVADRALDYAGQFGGTRVPEGRRLPSGRR